MSQATETEQVTQKPFGSGGKDSTREKERGKFHDYLQALKRAPATVNTYTSGLTPFFAFLDGQGITDLRAVRRNDVQAYQAHLIACGRYVTWSVQVFMRALRRFYDFLEKTGKVLVNPAETLEQAKPENRLPRAVLTLTEIRRLLNTPDTSLPAGIKNKAILELLYSTGLRVGELCALTVHDVDTRNGFIRVNRGKGGKDRIVPLGHKAAKYISEYIHHIRGNQTRRNRDERALFVNRNSNPLDRQNVQLMVKACARRAGIKKKITPHALRHTCATHMVADGANIVHVQRLLGHESLNTTQIYTRVAQREVKQTHARCHPRERQKT